MNAERQTYNRDDIVERIANQILKLMDDKELIEFCKANFGGENHEYDEQSDTVEFDLE